jgi:putative endonuclease
MSNKSIGNQGEQMACAYLTANGFSIIHTNWRYSHWEIDVIATKNNCLHFIEVKTRTNVQFGLPEESISPKKIKFVKQAAEEFLLKHPSYSLIQFDVLAISLTKKEQPIIDFFEDAFY